MVNIAKIKGAKDEKSNVEFSRGRTVVHLHSTDGKGWSVCANIPTAQFERDYEVISEDKPEGKE